MHDSKPVGRNKNILQAVVFIAVTVGYAVLCLGFYPKSVPGILVTGLIPIVVAGFFWGVVGGLVSAFFVAVVINTVILNLCGVSGWDATIKINGVFGVFGLFAIGGIVGWLSTLRKRLDKALQFREEVEKALNAKNAEILEFTNNLTHDLKKPLTTLKLIFAMMGKMAVEKTCSAHWEIHGTAKEAVDNMQELLDDLMQVAKLEYSKWTLEREPVEVSDLVGKVLERLKPQLEVKSIRVSVTAPVRVSAERKSLDKIISNLIGNAINYIGDKKDPAIEIGCIRRDKDYEFFIRDNGIGIPQTEQSKIFEKFIRGSNSAGISGTGLGLPIVKAAVLAHGGRVWVESRVGEGTAFYFTLPSA